MPAVTRLDPRPRAASATPRRAPALCVIQITSWGIVYYAFPVLAASEIRDLTADGLKRLDGFNQLLGLIDDRLAQLASLDESHTSELDHPADLAWNLFTAVYFKAGGFPWAPVGIPEGTCHLGVTFYRPHGERSAMRISVAQAFARMRSAAMSTTWSRSPRRPACGSCATASTRRPGARASAWATAATCTRPDTFPRLAATRTATSRPRSRSLTTSGIPLRRRCSPRCS
jgi:hypothetical protein